jgi:hypothetical protein
MNQLPEVWLRGQLPEIPALVQPVAHALLQSMEEIERYTLGFPDLLLWDRPAGTASPGFHLQHICGVLDRLFTYAQSLSLNEQQLHFLEREGKPNPDISLPDLIAAVKEQIILSIDYLKNLDPSTLTDVRTVGRKQLPSTHLGLLFHAAEHTQRHVGQLYVTLRVLHPLPAGE